MTIYEVLKQDHQLVLGLLDQLMKAENLELKVKQKIVQRVDEELIPHARAEEAVLYNSIRDIPIKKDVVSHPYREHLEVEALLRALQVTEAVNIDWKKGAKNLRDALSQHIYEEEGAVFKAAKELFSQEEAEAMAEVFNKMKSMVRKQSVVGTSVDALVNLMPSRLREAFSKYSLEGGAQAKVS